MYACLSGKNNTTFGLFPISINEIIKFMRSFPQNRKAGNNLIFVFLFGNVKRDLS